MIDERMKVCSEVIGKTRDKKIRDIQLIGQRVRNGLPSVKTQHEINQDIQREIIDCKLKQGFKELIMKGRNQHKLPSIKEMQSLVKDHHFRK